MMTLTEYMKKTNMRREDMAQLVGVTRQSISNYMEGKTIPKVDVAFRIQEVTKGKVKPRSFLKSAA